MLTEWAHCERCERAIPCDDMAPRRYVELSYYAGTISRSERRMICKECYRKIMDLVRACDQFRDATKKMEENGDAEH